MTSPARALQTNSDAIRRVEHLTQVAQLLLPASPDLAQYYLCRMQQAADKDHLKIPPRTSVKMCRGCGGFLTSTLRLVPAKRRSRRAAQLAARETKQPLHLDGPPSSHSVRNVFEQHCARCQHTRQYIAFQQPPQRTVDTPLSPAPRASAGVSGASELRGASGVSHSAGPARPTSTLSTRPTSTPSTRPTSTQPHAHKKTQLKQLLKATQQHNKKSVQHSLKDFLHTLDTP